MSSRQARESATPGMHGCLELPRIGAWLLHRRLRMLLAAGARACRTDVSPAWEMRTPAVLSGAGCLRLVVLGDSLAAGNGERVKGLEAVAWAPRVARALGTVYPDLHMVNLARNGLTTAEIAYTQRAAALALRPDVLIISAGGNDLLSRRWDAAAFRAEYD